MTEGEKAKGTRVIAELIISPFGVGSSLSKWVKEVVKVIDEYPDIRVLHTPMSTIIEAETVETILEVTKQAHLKLVEMGAPRISTTLRIDDRRDKPRRMEDKLTAIGKSIERLKS